MPLPANFFDDLSDRPNMYQRQQQIGAELGRAHWQSALAAYYGRITELDQMTGRLIDKLSTAGELENTIVVFVADHGRYVGSHGFDAHNFGGFEEIYRIPLVMAGPGIAAGEVRDNPISIADLGTTLCEIGSGHNLGHPDSASFLPLLGDENVDQSPDFVCGYAEYHGTRFPLMQRILWKDGWKFVFNGFDFDELYHLDEDPHEMRNRIDEPELRERVDDMMTEIWRRVQATGDRTIWESHYFSMRFASVGPLALRATNSQNLRTPRKF
jgi:arylsulfatase A-like enzyme